MAEKFRQLGFNFVVYDVHDPAAESIEVGSFEYGRASLAKVVEGCLNPNYSVPLMFEEYQSLAYRTCLCGVRAPICHDRARLFG